MNEALKEAAAMFVVTQPRISDLMHCKINLFSLDTLIDMAATADTAPVVKVSMLKTSHAKHSSRWVAAHA